MKAPANNSESKAPKTNELLSKLFKYILVGGSAALVNWILFYLCLESGLWYILAGVLSFILATLWNFILAKKFVFLDSQHTIIKEGLLIYLVSFGGLLIDIGILFLCVEVLNFHALFAKLIATGTAFVFNFTLRYAVIYKKNS